MRKLNCHQEKHSKKSVKVSKRLRKDYPNLLVKKPTPGTPDSAIAECSEEDHVSAKGEMEPKDNLVSELSSTTEAEDTNTTSATPNVAE